MVLLCSLVLFSETVDHGLLGKDTFVIIDSARVVSWADWLDTFRRPLMDHYNLYRPVFNLSVALDYALWGLDPLGYPLTNMVFFAVTAAALGLVTGRLVGREAGTAQFACVSAFLLFPQHYEVVPVVARRPEMMVSAFGLLAVWAQVSPRALARRAPALSPALFALLAMGSKDNGLGLQPLCFLAVLLCSPAPTRGGRWRHALRAMIPHAVVLAGFLSVRLAVLKGIGGGPASRYLEGIGETPARVSRMLAPLLRPEPLEAPSAIAGWLLPAFLVALVLASAMWAAESRRGAAAERPPAGTPARAAWIGAGWLGLMIAMYTVRGIWRTWYVFPLAVGASLLLGAGAGHLRNIALGRRGGSRWAACGALVLLTLLVAWNGQYSPVVRHYPEWKARTAELDAFYAELHRRIEVARASEGVAVVELPELSARADVPDDQPRVRPVKNVSKKSLRAWLRLAEPGLRFRLAGPSEAEARGKVDVVIVSPSF